MSEKIRLDTKQCLLLHNSSCYWQLQKPLTVPFLLYSIHSFSVSDVTIYFPECTSRKTQSTGTSTLATKLIFKVIPIVVRIFLDAVFALGNNWSSVSRNLLCHMTRGIEKCINKIFVLFLGRAKNHDVAKSVEYSARLNFGIGSFSH